MHPQTEENFYGILKFYVIIFIYPILCYLSFKTTDANKKQYFHKYSFCNWIYSHFGNIVLSNWKFSRITNLKFLI